MKIKRVGKMLFISAIIFCVFSLTIEVKAESYKTYTIGQEIKFNPITGEYCTSGNNCKTFNVINTGEDGDYYEMQLNYNLIANSTWGDIKNGPTVAVAELKEATKNWKGIETYTSTDNIELPSRNGSYTVNYNGSKARMITAEEVAALYNYQTVSGNKWTWNGLGTSNNIKFDVANRWLGQNLGLSIYSNKTYGHVYDDVETEKGHFPFNYFTASATIDDRVYTVESSIIALDAMDVSDDYGDYDTGLRPIIKLRKELQGTSNIQPKEVLITGPEVEPDNIIPSLSDIKIPFSLKNNDYFWLEKCGENNYKEVLAGKTFTEGCTYELYIDFNTNDLNNKNNENIDITSNEIIFKYNSSLAYKSDYSYDAQLTYAKFKFESIKKETSNEVDNPSSDDIVDEPLLDDKVDNPSSDDIVDEPLLDDKVDNPSLDDDVNKPEPNDELTNPKTSDSIYNSVVLLLLSALSISILFKIKFKNDN